MSTPSKSSAFGLNNVEITLNLTPRQTRVCVLHLLEGRSQREIARWMGLTERAVRKALAQSLAKAPRLDRLRQPIPRVRPVPLSQLTSRGTGKASVSAAL